MNYTLNCQGKLLHITAPIVMGIINLTPDSFYSTSRANTEAAIFDKINQMQAEGATLIDLGAQSTRPDSTLLTAEEEIARLQAWLPKIIASFPDLLFSIDTFYAAVAQYALEQGVHMVNDISGGQMDATMLPTVAQYRAPYICMHMQGTPQTMQKNPQYQDIVAEQIDFFIAQKLAAQKLGIHDFIIDPGFGFGKTIAHNYELLQKLDSLVQAVDAPLLAGLSRKSMIYKPLRTTPEDSLIGTAALHMLALQKGASILRVHDVKEAVQVIKLWRLAGKSY